MGWITTDEGNHVFIGPGGSAVGGKAGYQLAQGSAAAVRPQGRGRIKAPETALGGLKLSASHQTETMANEVADNNDMRDKGVQEVHQALASTGDDKVVLRDFNNGGKIVGAAAFDPGREVKGELHISHLGSTGDVKGTGAELMRHVVSRAVARNLSISFESTPSAEGFYERLGFTRSNKSGGGTVYEANLEQVKDIAGRLGSPGRTA